MFFIGKTNNNNFNNRENVGHDITEFSENEKVKTKAPMTYRAMIGCAILCAPQQKLTLSEIYEVIEKNFPVFTATRCGWKNTVRHNLSLHECFVKGQEITRRRGCYWRLNARFEESFRKEMESSSVRGTEKIHEMRRVPEEDTAYGHFEEASSPTRKITNKPHRGRHSWGFEPYQTREFTATYRVHHQELKSNVTPCCCQSWSQNQRSLVMQDVEFNDAYNTSPDRCSYDAMHAIYP